MLVRAIRPVLPEMDEFHKALYVVYHKYLPDKKWDEVRKAAPGLLAKAEAVAKAQLPKRYEAKAAEFKAASAALVEAAQALAGTGNDGSALDTAVNQLHAKYEALTRIFE
jgi:hypothetical protein